MNKKRVTTHNIKQLGFSGLRWFGSRFNFLQRLIGTQPENATVSYCQTLAVSVAKPENITSNKK
jgi:hypothetical protein